MATVPNQRKVIVHREKCEKSFLQIKKENWFAANKDLEPYGLQVYLYLAGNRDGFTLELSQEAAEREAGIKKTSFHKYVNLMIEKGYLVQRGDGSNLYDFYERPHEQKKKAAAPAGKLIRLRGENAGENYNPSDELLRLLDESEDLRGDSVSSQRSKEIYNKGDTSQNKKINTDDVFVFQINGQIRIKCPL